MITMDTGMKTRLKSCLIGHEGLRLKAYPDTLGNITIGIGRNLTGRGISAAESDMFFDNDVDFFFNFLCSYPWFADLSENRQIALIDLCFAGTKTFQSFRKMIVALEKKDYVKAAAELLDSKYATQVGKRATDLADMIRNG